MTSALRGRSRSARRRSTRSPTSGRWRAAARRVRSTIPRRASVAGRGGPGDARRRARGARRLRRASTRRPSRRRSKRLVAARAVKPREVYQPLRVAICGTTVSPGIFESVALLGREETLRRIDAALAREIELARPALNRCRELPIGVLRAADTDGRMAGHPMSSTHACRQPLPSQRPNRQPKPTPKARKAAPRRGCASPRGTAAAARLPRVSAIRTRATAVV